MSRRLPRAEQYVKIVRCAKNVRPGTIERSSSEGSRENLALHAAKDAVTVARRALSPH